MWFLFDNEEERKNGGEIITSTSNIVTCKQAQLEGSGESAASDRRESYVSQPNLSGHIRETGSLQGSPGMFWEDFIYILVDCHACSRIHEASATFRQLYILVM